MRESTDLKRLETRITELEQLLKARETDLARLSSDAKYARTKIDHYRNRNMMLAAAHEAAVGTWSSRRWVRSDLLLQNRSDPKSVGSAAVGRAVRPDRAS